MEKTKSLYIRLKNGEVHKTIQDKSENDLFYDLDKNGKCIGIELLNFLDIEYNGKKLKISKE